MEENNRRDDIMIKYTKNKSLAQKMMQNKLFIFSLSSLKMHVGKHNQS